MEKVHPWSGQPSDRGRLKNRTEVSNGGWGPGGAWDVWSVASQRLQQRRRHASLLLSSQALGQIIQFRMQLNISTRTYHRTPGHYINSTDREPDNFAFSAFSLQRFDTFGWGSGRASRIQKLSGEVLLWLYVWKEVQVVCIWYSWFHCIPKTHNLLPHLNPGCPGKEAVKQV